MVQNVLAQNKTFWYEHRMFLPAIYHLSGTPGQNRIRSGEPCWWAVHTGLAGLDRQVNGSILTHNNSLLIISASKSVPTTCGSVLVQERYLVAGLRNRTFREFTGSEKRLRVRHKNRGKYNRARNYSFFFSKIQCWGSVTFWCGSGSMDPFL